MTVTGGAVASQPFASVTVTMYSPEAVTTIAWVVAPFDQSHDAPVLAVRVTLWPSQNVVGPLAVIVAVAAVMATSAELFEAQAVVTVTARLTLDGPYFLQRIAGCVQPFGCQSVRCQQYESSDSRTRSQTTSSPPSVRSASFTFRIRMKSEPVFKTSYVACVGSFPSRLTVYRIVIVRPMLEKINK